MDDDQIDERAVAAVDTALADTLDGDMPMSWVLVADTMMPDGSRRQWHLRSEGLDLPQHLGLLEWASAQTRAATMMMVDPDDDDG